MRILFSPVGGTDPISMNNWHDGALLHICRELQPDKVIMYMSKEILKNHEYDNRYIYCLNKLCEIQGRKMYEYEIIKRPELTNVQEFDYFYQDFREIIASIVKGMSANDELLFNISSGTPAMKSGIAVLKTIEEYPCKSKLIQVLTPTKKMNEHTHEGYSVEELWEVDLDNETDHENRCRVIDNLPTLAQIKKEEIIKMHIAAYDYSAALTVAKTISGSKSRKYYNLLEIAQSRLLLDNSAVNNKIKTAAKKFRQVIEEARGCSKDREYRECFEYALSLQIKLIKEEYADFVRAITPLLVRLMKMALKHTCGIDIEKYCIDGKWNKNKLIGTDVYDILFNSYESGFRNGPVYSAHLNEIIQVKSNDQTLKKLSKDLRKVEEQIRNMAAHQIVTITDRDIELRTGYSGKQIMNKIKALFNYAGETLDDKDWESY